MSRLRFRALLLCGLAAALSARAAVSTSRTPDTISAELCASCHGPNLTGGTGPNLLDVFSNHGNNEEALLRSISRGWPEYGMPAFEGVLTAGEMQAMVQHLRQQRREFAAGNIKAPVPPDTLTARSERHAFRIETFVANLDTPWGMAFLPDGRILVTERPGRLRIIAGGRLEPAAVRGTPVVVSRADGGMLDVIAHPDYARNGWIYLAYTEAGPVADTSMTVVVRGRIRAGEWTDQEDIFRAPPVYYYPGYIHYGCRFLFDPAGHLFFSIGDRGRNSDAQDLASPSGKIHRVHDDGRAPADNPFARQPGAWASIWTFGHRHVQGLSLHPVTSQLWATEHGPSGGDELNLIERGRNYGWPVISNGMERRQPLPTARPGMESPVVFWIPTLAPSGIQYYTGDKFPAWKHHLLVGGLAGEQLRRVEIEGERVVHQEILFRGMGRVRAVATGPDGLIYLALNNPGRIARMLPVDPLPAAATIQSR